MRSLRNVGFALAALVSLLGVHSAHAAFAWLNPNDPNPADPTRDYFYSNGSTDEQRFVASGTNPTLLPTSIKFTPTNFKAQSANGTAAITSDTVRFELHVKPGKQLLGFTVNELGDYSISGSGPNTFVKATGYLQLVNLDTNAVMFTSLSTTPAALSSTGVFANVPNPPSDPSGILWSGTESIIAIPVGWKNIEVTINNVLQANSNLAFGQQSGTSSQIEKKFVSGGVEINLVIPEPASLSTLAMLSLPLMRRRRAA